MDFSRLSRGERVVGVSGALLLIFMWFKWYAPKVTTPPGGGGTQITVSTSGVTAWQAFTAIDIFLFLVAAGSIALVLLRASGTTPDLPVPAELVIATAGAIATLLIIFRLIDAPIQPQTFPGFEVSVSRKLGAFLGLLAAAGVAVGGWLALNERRGGEYVPPIR